MDDWDVLHDATPPHLHWTTGNIGEAVPGVQTPLSWSIWGPTIERAMRGAFHAVGAFDSKEAVLPGRGDRMTQVFYGRGAFRVEDLTSLGDRMPGTTGQEIAAGMFGEAPGDIIYTPTKRRYPFVAVGLPRQLFGAPKKLRPAVATTGPWWHQQIDDVDGLHLPQTLVAFKSAYDRFDHNVALQAITLFCAVQPMYDALTRLTTKVGVGDAAQLAGGYGGVPETAVVADLWRASRGEIELSEVVRIHGFHGPMEGELSAHVWREDPTPLNRFVSDYAKRRDNDDPRIRDAARYEARLQLERDLIAGVPWPARPAVKMLLRRAEISIPLRGSAKNAFLQAFDVVRATARHAGRLMADQGTLAEPDDVFYLTDGELLAGVGPEIKEIIALRKERRTEYLGYRLPEAWTGSPKPIPVGTESGDDRPMSLTGTGASPGIVEGIARVVADPTFADVEDDEILVSATTDPSWASIMFISSALVVDIGGVMSHAAVVAREIGIPCVVATGNGSQVLRSGDKIRVDGKAGTVEILESAP